MLDCRASLQVKAPSQPPGEGGPAAGGAAPPPPPGQPAPGGSRPLDLGLEQKLLEELKASGSSASGGGSGGGAGGVQVGGPQGAVAAAQGPLPLAPRCRTAPAAAPPVPRHAARPALPPCPPPLQDPYEMLLRRYTDMGYSRDEVAMGLAIAGPDAADDADKIGAGVLQRSAQLAGWAGWCGSAGGWVGCVRMGCAAVRPAANSCPLPARPPPLVCLAAVESCRKYKSLASMGFRGDQVVGALLLAQGDEEAAIQTCLDANAT